MYTDGITEAMNERDEFHGVERLQKVLIENGRSSASEICESIWKSFQNHLGDVSQQDDVTILSRNIGCL